MPPVKCAWLVLGLAMLSFQGLSPDSLAQVAFEPIIGSAPTGETMTVTPAVSADRRYVRLSVNGFFNTVNGFTSFTTPLGAVGGVGASGGGLGGGGLGGGLGGLGGGLGGVGGLRSVGGFGADGVTVNAGMNGVIGPAGFESAMGYATSGFVGTVGELRAGAFPHDRGFDSGMYDYPSVTRGFLGRDDRSANPARQSGPAAETARSDRSRSPGGRTAVANTTAATRRPVPKSVARREKARSAHAARLKKASDEEPVIKPKAPSVPDSPG